MSSSPLYITIERDTAVIARYYRVRVRQTADAPALLTSSKPLSSVYQAKAAAEAIFGPLTWTNHAGRDSDLRASASGTLTFTPTPPPAKPKHTRWRPDPVSCSPTRCLNCGAQFPTATEAEAHARNCQPRNLQTIRDLWDMRLGS